MQGEEPQPRHPVPLRREGNMAAPTLSPPLTQSQGSVNHGEGARKATSVLFPMLHPPPLRPVCPPGPCLPLLAPRVPCLSLSCPCPTSPPTAPCGRNPPIAMSRLLGGFHASVIILPVTATTCGAPSGGPGTTSESHRSGVHGGPLGPNSPHGIAKPQGHRQGQVAPQRTEEKESWCRGPALTQVPRWARGQTVYPADRRVPASPVT